MRAPAQTLILAAILLHSGACARNAVAQETPDGPQFVVDTYTTNSQERPSVAMDGLGNLVAVWPSLGSYGDDHDGFSIQARLFDASGQPLGDEFQVNTYTTSFQLEAAVATNPQGGFVVAWVSQGSFGDDDSQTSIQARRFAADGSPLGDQFQVNTYTADYQESPAVAVDGDGNFLVAWYGRGSGGSDTDGYSVHARRYRADGQALGGELQVNSYTTGSQASPAVAALAGNGFVVVWESAGSFGSDSDGDSIQARHVAIAGPVPADGPELQVNALTTSSQRAPSVAAGPDGGFVVAWISPDADPGTPPWVVEARRFGADFTPLGVEIRADTAPDGGALDPTVASSPGDGFVVAWESYADGDDSLRARRFDAQGTPYREEFVVNSLSQPYPQRPRAAMSPAGDFVVAWSARGADGDPGINYGVVARRFVALFRDGFESGDAARWSSITP